MVTDPHTTRKGLLIDLERKLEVFRNFYNSHRVHTTLDDETPSEISGKTIIHRADLNKF